MKFKIRIDKIFNLPSISIITGEATHLSFKGKITDGKKTLVVASALDGNLYKNDVAFSVLKGKVSKDDIGSIFEEVA